MNCMPEIILLLTQKFILQEILYNQKAMKDQKLKRQKFKAKTQKKWF